MSDLKLKHLLEDLARNAGEYDVIDRAWQTRHAGRRRFAAAGGVATMVVALAVAIGVVATRPHQSSVTPPPGSPPPTPTAAPR
jgi:hypothetical protein